MSENVDDIGENPIEPEENDQWEFTPDYATPCNYVDTSLNVLCYLADLPTNPERSQVEERYIKRSKKFAIRIMHHYLEQMYKEIEAIEDKKDEDE